MKKLKVAVIGLGSMGKHHTRVYSQMNNVNLVAIVDHDIEMGKIAQEYGVEFYTDYHDLPKVDAVNIVTPTVTHKDIALHFLSNQIHCLVEKPISFDLESAEKLVKCAIDNNVILSIGHIENFNPAVVKLKEIIDQGILGNLMFLCGRRVGPPNVRIVDVGILIDLASHEVGVIQYLLGKEPFDVYSKNWGIKNSKGDYAILILDFDKIAASIEVNWFTSHSIRTLDVTGTKGTAHLDYIKQEIIVDTSEWEMFYKVDKQEPLKIELTHFVDCILNKSIPKVDGTMGLSILKTIILAGGK